MSPRAIQGRADAPSDEAWFELQAATERIRRLDGPGAGLACARAVPSCATIEAQNQDSEEKATKGSVMGS